MPERQQLTEAHATLTAESTGTPGRYLVKIIDGGWGSSGFYSTEVLEAAGRNKVFAEGLKMFRDHPTDVEKAERPERSVNDVWGRLVTDATWDGTSLVAEAEIRPDVRPVVDFLKESIGLSIRAYGQFEMGEAEGRSGRLITSLDEAASVDFVTDAGRGGRILSLVESAQRLVLGEATANDTRDALGNAVNELYAVADTTWVWVRDFDADAGLVYFDVSGSGDQTGTFQQSYTLASDGSAELTGERTEVTVRTNYVPVNPAGVIATQESLEDSMAQIQIEEGEHARLVAEAGRVQTLEAERATAIAERDTAQRALAETDARNAARPIVVGILAESTTLPAQIVSRVVESVVAAAPLTEAGALDETALRTAATAARTAAETEVAAIAESLGAGKVRGFGSSTTTDLSESDYDRRSASVFNRPTVKGA